MKIHRNARCPNIASTLLLALALVSTGCGSGDMEGNMFAEANDSNIKRVSSLYAVFQGQHMFKGPKDEAELKAFVSQQDKDRLKKIGVDASKLDELFISERDSQPFKIRWELVAKPRQGPIPIIFEQDGVGGKYMVAYSSYICKEVDKGEYDLLWAGKKDNEPADENRGGVPGK